VSNDITGSEKKTIHQVEQYLKSIDRRMIIVDNTNSNRNTRSKYIALASKYNVNIMCVQIELPLIEAKKRNDIRFQTTGKKVTPIALHMYLKKYEEPSLDEGFSVVYTRRNYGYNRENNHSLMSVVNCDRNITSASPLGVTVDERDVIIHTDGGCNKETGNAAWGSVVNPITGHDMLEKWKDIIQIELKRVYLSKLNDEFNNYCVHYFNDNKIRKYYLACVNPNIITKLKLMGGFLSNDRCLLMEKYQQNPYYMRKCLRKELNLSDNDAANLFALIIYFCDNYLSISNHIDKNIKRFFNITSKLHQELQMLISNIKYYHNSNIIPYLDREKAFKYIL